MPQPTAAATSMAFQGLVPWCKQGDPPDAVSASWEIKNNYTTFPICQMQAKASAWLYRFNARIHTLHTYSPHTAVGAYVHPKY